MRIRESHSQGIYCLRLLRRQVRMQLVLNSQNPPRLGCSATCSLLPATFRALLIFPYIHFEAYRGRGQLACQMGLATVGSGRPARSSRGLEPNDWGRRQFIARFARIISKTIIAKILKSPLNGLTVFSHLARWAGDLSRKHRPQGFLFSSLLIVKIQNQGASCEVSTEIVVIAVLLCLSAQCSSHRVARPGHQRHIAGCTRKSPRGRQSRGDQRGNGTHRPRTGSDASGGFNVLLPAANYSIAVEAEGFAGEDYRSCSADHGNYPYVRDVEPSTVKRRGLRFTRKQLPDTTNATTASPSRQPPSPLCRWPRATSSSCSTSRRAPVPP